MRVLVNHTDYGLRKESRERTLLYYPQAEFVDSTGDPYGYWQAVQDRWTGEEPLVVIEQDMLITKWVPGIFESCMEDWCTFAYEVWDFFTYWSLGCTRFSAAVQRQFPEIPKVAWYHLDGTIRTMLWDHRMPHCHGMVGHMHEYETWKLDNLRMKRARHMEIQGDRTIKEALADWQNDPWSWA